MTRVVEVELSDQLVANVEPILAQGEIDLKAYILEALTWYTHYLHKEQMRPATVSWADSDAEEQARLLWQIHEELAPYAAEALQAALGDEKEDWEAILG